MCFIHISITSQDCSEVMYVHLYELFCICLEFIQSLLLIKCRLEALFKLLKAERKHFCAYFMYVLILLRITVSSFV